MASIQVRRIGRLVKVAAAAVVLGQFALGTAHAAPLFSIYLGYADGLRGTTNFPSIWQGDSGVTFNGGGSVTANSDTGAIMLINTGSTALTISNLLVNGFQGASTYSLWATMIGAGEVIAAGDKAIFTQTGNYNFDTSDTSPGFTQGSPSSAQPTVTFTLSDAAGAVSTAICHDTGQVLNTGGFDTASIGNEALGWRLCGTTGIGNPGNQIPEPGSFGLAGLALLGLAAGLRRRSAA